MTVRRPSPRLLSGAGWDSDGEVTAGIYRALGCVGAVIDRTVRDLDEVKAAGFKVLARRPCVGYAHAWPVRWGCKVKVFGT